MPGKDAQPRPKYNAETKRRLVALLERRRDREALDSQGRPRVVTSIAIARALKLHPNAGRETRRRRVRELVAEARAEGAPIASRNRGYWPADTVEDFELTERFLRGMGLAQLATAGRLKRSPTKARLAGQLTLAPLAHRGVRGAVDFYRSRLGTPPTARPTTEPPPPRDGLLFDLGGAT